MTPDQFYSTHFLLVYADCLLTFITAALIAIACGALKR